MCGDRPKAPCQASGASSSELIRAALFEDDGAREIIEDMVGFFGFCKNGGAKTSKTLMIQHGGVGFLIDF